MQIVMLWIKMWTESQGRLPMYLLVGGSGLNVVHACSFFFFFFFKEKKSTRHAYQWSWQNEDFSRDLEFGHASQRSDGFEVLDVPRGLMVWWIWNLDMLPRGPMDLNLEVLLGGPMDWSLEVLLGGLMVWFWTCFPEVHWNWIWTCFPEVRWLEV